MTLGLQGVKIKVCVKNSLPSSNARFLSIYRNMKYIYKYIIIFYIGHIGAWDWKTKKSKTLKPNLNDKNAKYGKVK